MLPLTHTYTLTAIHAGVSYTYRFKLTGVSSCHCYSPQPLLCYPLFLCKERGESSFPVSLYLFGQMDACRRKTENISHQPNQTGSNKDSCVVSKSGQLHRSHHHYWCCIRCRTECESHFPLCVCVCVCVCRGERESPTFSRRRPSRRSGSAACVVRTSTTSAPSAEVIVASRSSQHYKSVMMSENGSRMLDVSYE